MTLAKQQRNEIYKEALKMLQEEIKVAHSPYICPNLRDLMGLMGLNRKNIIEYELPEFYHQKPLDLEIGDPWWPDNEEGNNCRVAALLKAIELTENE